MSDIVSATAPSAATPKKKGPSGKAAAAVAMKKTKNAPPHPKVSEMVTSAITALKERGGSSLQAIKKHIASHYKVDVDRLSPFIKKYLKSAVGSGTLVQTKGKGATGSFKLSGSQKAKETTMATATTVSKPKAKKVVSSASSGNPSGKKETAKKATKAPSSAKKAPRPKATKASEKKIKKKTPIKKATGAKKATKAKSPKKVVKATKPKSPKPKKAPKKAAAATKKPAKK